MSKSTYWFKHDVNAHLDGKVKALMAVYGAEGYGYYWIIIELMRQEDGCKLSISRKFDIPSLAQSLPNCDKDKCKEFIDDCIEEFELFKTDGEFMWSDRLMESYEAQQSKSRKAQMAAYKKHGKDKHGNPIKKENPFDDMDTTPADDKPEDPAKIKDKRVLNDDKLFDLLVERMKEHDDFKAVATNKFQSEREKCLDWLSANGKVKKDYKAFFRTWMRNNFNAPAQQTQSSIPLKSGQKPMIL